MKSVIIYRALLLPAMLVMPAFSVAAAVQNGAPTQDSAEPYDPDADALAAEMRVLGANPLDEGALINAGELTLKLGDIDAAAAFFGRAARINPRNARTKAGMARSLLHIERPGEALRLFDEAETLGYDPVLMASERGLAFDLIGEQERAQRQYRLALKRGPDDETLRRYALSLGISGKRDLAFEQIDTLLRRSDRAAWRVRAFVLAMTGDVAGAETIATSMLPGGMANGLLPFFSVLATLGPVDRAFAVHFGEVRPTPQRIADARLIPPLPALAPEPVAPVAVAAVRLPPVNSREDRRKRRRGGRDRERVALVVPPAAKPALPPPPSIVAAAAAVTPSPDRLAQAAPVYPVPSSGLAPTTSRPPVQVASARPVPTRPLEPRPTEARSTEARPTEVTLPRAPAEVTVSRPVPATLPPARPTATPPAPAPIVADVAKPIIPPEPDVIVAEAPAVAANAAPASPAVPAEKEESILARIIATVGVPANELDVPPVKGPPAKAPPVVVASAAPPQRAGPVVPDPIGYVDPAQAEADRKAAAKKAAAKLAADKAAAAKKLADKQASDEKAAKAKLLKANPSRIWVQVAGGASVPALPREWTRLKGKAPAAFKARSGYTTPLRFTNRLLTGPFKTEDEAQGFVNTIAKSGLTGFVFTSEAGQVIDKLPAK